MICGNRPYYIDFLILAGFLFFFPLMPYSCCVFFCDLLVEKAEVAVVKAVGLISELLSIAVPLYSDFPGFYSSSQHYLVKKELASALSMGLIIINQEKQYTTQKL